MPSRDDVAVIGAPFLDLTLEGIQRVPSAGEELVARALHATPGGTATQARVLASTVLRESLRASDFQRSNAARRAQLDSLFQDRVLDEGVLLASLVAADGTVSYSTDHRQIGTRIAAP